MNSHKNARLTVHGRVLVVRRALEQGMRPAEVAQAMGVSVRTVHKWLRRYREEGWAGLHNRSSRPRCCSHRTPEGIRQQVIQRRRQCQTCRRIAGELGISVSTVARIARAAGLGRLPGLEPPPPVCRYEHKAPGDLLHLDIKRLARFQIPGHRVTGNRRQASRAHRLRRDPPRRNRPKCLPRPACRHPLLRPPRHPHPPHPHRQRRRLPIPRLPKPLPPPRPRASLHPPLHPAHQRQGRTLHPNRPARMGLRTPLPVLPPTRPIPPRLAALLQLAPPPRRTGLPTPSQQTPSRERRGEITQLEHPVAPLSACARIPLTKRRRY